MGLRPARFLSFYMGSYKRLSHEGGLGFRVITLRLKLEQNHDMVFRPNGVRRFEAQGLGSLYGSLGCRRVFEKLYRDPFKGGFGVRGLGFLSRLGLRVYSELQKVGTWI